MKSWEGWQDRSPSPSPMLRRQCFVIESGIAQLSFDAGNHPAYPVSISLEPSARTSWTWLTSIVIVAQHDGHALVAPGLLFCPLLFFDSFRSPAVIVGCSSLAITVPGSPRRRIGSTRFSNEPYHTSVWGPTSARVLLRPLNHTHRAHGGAPCFLSSTAFELTCSTMLSGYD